MPSDSLKYEWSIWTLGKCLKITMIKSRTPWVFSTLIIRNISNNKLHVGSHKICLTWKWTYKNAHTYNWKLATVHAQHLVSIHLSSMSECSFVNVSIILTMEQNWFVLFYFWDTISLYSISWLWTYSVNQADLKVVAIDCRQPPNYREYVKSYPYSLHFIYFK